MTTALTTCVVVLAFVISAASQRTAWNVMHNFEVKVPAHRLRTSGCLTLVWHNRSQ
jgi:hypothetical protein